MSNERGVSQYPLNQIYFYLTEGCNLRCRHCWIAPKHQTECNTYPALDLDLFKSIIEQAKPLGLRGVKLTGGEPLLHPKISEILEYIQTQELRLTVETNGVLCTPELAEKMAVGREYGSWFGEIQYCAAHSQRGENARIWRGPEHRGTCGAGALG
ncbi:MAG: radical SAM protein [Deltaproteobacteria bacterium]